MKDPTAFVIISALVILLAYDLYAVLSGGFSATISWVIYQASLKYPIIPFAGGVVCGHFWWSQ
jgi:hypothetical protein